MGAVSFRGLVGQDVLGELKGLALDAAPGDQSLRESRFARVGAPFGSSMARLVGEGPHHLRRGASQRLGGMPDGPEARVRVP
jgi:hypothetical protein